MINTPEYKDYLSYLSKGSITDIFENLTKNTKKEPVDIFEDTKNGNLVINVSLAGFTKDEIDISEIFDKIVITAERETKIDNSYKVISENIKKSREITIVIRDDYVGGERKAEFENGILTIYAYKSKQFKSKNIPLV